MASRLAHLVLALALIFMMGAEPKDGKELEYGAALAVCTIVVAICGFIISKGRNSA